MSSLFPGDPPWNTGFLEIQHACRHIVRASASPSKQRQHFIRDSSSAEYIRDVFAQAREPPREITSAGDFAGLPQRKTARPEFLGILPGAWNYRDKRPRPESTSKYFFARQIALAWLDILARFAALTSRNVQIMSIDNPSCAQR